MKLEIGKKYNLIGEKGEYDPLEDMVLVNSPENDMASVSMFCKKSKEYGDSLEIFALFTRHIKKIDGNNILMKTEPIIVYGISPEESRYRQYSKIIDEAIK